MIRFLVALIFVVLFLIITLPLQLVLMLIRKKWPAAPDKISYPLVGWCLKSLYLIAGIKLTVVGKENIPTDRAVLFIGNHGSFFDILLTYPEVIRPTGYLAKKELGKVPGLNFWMYVMHCIFLDRKDIKKGLQCILECIDLVNNGVSMTVFPEGTRNKNRDELMEFHEASFKIATKTKCPIIPMCITYEGEVFEDHLPKLKPGRAIVEYGKPIYIDELEVDQKKRIGAYTRDILSDMYKSNKEKLS